MPLITTQRMKGLAAFCGVLIGVSALVGAQDGRLSTEQEERFKAQIVAGLLQRAHLSKPDLDDKVAAEWHENYIEGFDRLKLYFTKSDIEEFEEYQTKIDDQLRQGDLSFASIVFERFKERLEERYDTVNELLDHGFDFTIDEVYIDDPEKVDYPADAEEARERWRLELKYQLLRRTLGDLDEIDEAIDRLKITYKDQLRFFNLFDEEEEVLERYLSSMARAIDPHSEYIGWKNLEDMMNQQIKLQMEGIGATLSIEDGLPTIQQVVPGGAAARDGRLKSGDKIVGVEHSEGEIEEFIDKKLSDVVRVIRGDRGTKVRLIVEPAGSKERKTIVITRDKIEFADQRAKGEIIDVPSTDGGEPLRVGVIDLPSFYGDTAAVRRQEEGATSATLDCERILKEFEEEGVDGVLVDLRSNPGGLLLEAISLSGLFIDSGPVVRVRDSDRIIPYNDDDKGTAYSGPLVVLISKTSASASEIFAGVIKDYGRGLIIGDSSTFGKGTVQSIIALDEWVNRRDLFENPLGALKLTIQQFYRANGMSTQARGVMPDIHIPSSFDHIENLGEGEMENALPFDEIKPLPHTIYNQVPAELVAMLNERSLGRRGESEDFRKQADAISRLIERQERHTIPLERNAFRTEFNADDEDDDPVEELIDEPINQNTPRDVWDEDNFYNQEVIKIVADYLTLGSEALAAAPSSLDGE